MDETKTETRGVRDADREAEREAALRLPEAEVRRLHWSGGAAAGGFDYDASAEPIEVHTDEGELLGTMFSLGYLRAGDDGQVGGPERPVTFCYNGGPGSSSVPVNFGGMGPVTIETAGTQALGMHPGTHDNPHTLLIDTDLVFLDALGTGWSRVAPGVDPKRVWGVDGDANAFARAIVAWLDAHDRWASPVYLFGESYGTVRNAVLMRLLSERGVDLAGVTMLSALFDFVQTQPTSDLYHIGMLPTFAACAQWFDKAGVGVGEDEWFDEAVEFAQGDYAHALLLGDELPEREITRVARRYARLTSLPAEFVRERNLRVELDDFRRELLRTDGLVCGRLDMRFSSPAPQALQRSTDAFAGEDAADAAVESAMLAAFRAHVRSTLGYRGPANYLLSNFEKVGGSWDWRHAQPGMDQTPIVNVCADIAQTLRVNPTMRLLVLGGRYDAATTWWNVRHDVAALHLAPSERERVEFRRYGCGHMAYIDAPTLKAMASDLHEFYARR